MALNGLLSCHFRASKAISSMTGPLVRFVLYENEIIFDILNPVLWALLFNKHQPSWNLLALRSSQVSIRGHFPKIAASIELAFSCDPLNFDRDITLFGFLDGFENGPSLSDCCCPACSCSCLFWMYDRHSRCYSNWSQMDPLLEFFS
jgi:hypothetical protein